MKTITLLNGYKRIPPPPHHPGIQTTMLLKRVVCFSGTFEKKRNYNSEKINYSRNKQKREYETDKTAVERECLFILCMRKSDTVMLIIMRVSHCGIQRDYTGTCGDEII